MNERGRSGRGPISNIQQQIDPKDETMSDQENRKLQHTDEQKPDSAHKSGNLPNQPVQQKQENPSGQPKIPRSEPEKHDQEKKKQA
jgi:hypothetical protein